MSNEKHYAGSLSRIDDNPARCWHGIYTDSPCLADALWQEPISVAKACSVANTGAWRACDRHKRPGMIPLIPRHPEPDHGW